MWSVEDMKILDFFEFRYELYFGLAMMTILNIAINKVLQEKINWRHSLIGYVLFFYFILTFSSVTSFPTILEWKRLLNLDESIYNPNVNLIPFNDKMDFSFFMNIIWFIPIGFLLPVMSKKYQNFADTFIFGFILSLTIELGQLFLLYRVSDVNDLITNSFGISLGWLIFWLVHKLSNNLSTNLTKFSSVNENIITKYEPYWYLFLAALSVFLFGI